jgi:FMN phosphatase YigB (HAD superfamily)
VTGEISRSFAPADLGDMTPPTIRLDVTFDSAGNLQALGDLAAADVAPLSGITLPPDAMAALSDLGADELTIVTDDNQLNISSTATQHCRWATMLPRCRQHLSWQRRSWVIHR